MRRTVLTAFLAASAAFGLAPQAQAGNLVINTGLSTPTDKAAFAGFVDGFTAAHPDTHVQVNVFGHEEEKTAIRNWLATDPPDLVYWYPGVRMLTFVKPGLFASISDVWTKTNLAAKVAPGVTEQLTYDGKQWGMPYGYYMWGMYYRKDIFQKNNIAIPKNWADFQAACAKLKAAGITPVALGDKELWPAAGWFDYLDMRINGFAAHEDLLHGKIAFSSPGVRKVLDTWASLVRDKDFTENATSYLWQDAERFLFSGKAAMMLIGSFILPTVPADMAPNIGFFDFPVINPSAGLAEDAPIDMISMTGGAKDKGESAAFLAAMTDPAAQSKLAAGLGELPVLTDAAASSPLMTQQAKLLSKIPHFAQFFDRDTTPEMATVGMQQFQRLLYDPSQVPAIVQALDAQQKDEASGD
jgi:multiple sugar transport system substrate-binding protein